MRLFSSKRVTGVYIGEEKIALSQLTRGLKGVQIEKKVVAEVPSGESTSNEDSVRVPFDIKEREEESKYADTLSKLIRENDIETDNLLLVLPSRDIMVRYFTLPALSRSEVDSAVKFEAKKYVPFKTEDIYSDFHVIQSGKSKKKTGILYTAIKKELVKKRLAVLEECDLDIQAIRIPSLCLLNMLQNCRGVTEDKKNVPYMMVDVNEGIATITIFKNGIPYLIRDFAIFSPSKDRKGEGVSEEEYKNFLHELHLSLEYYYGQFPTESINEIFLIDDGTLNERAKDLGAEFNVPITQPNLSQALKEGQEGEYSSQEMLAIAVGYRNLVKSKIDINLLPTKEKKIFSRKQLSLQNLILPRPIIIEVVGLIIGMLVLYLVFGQKMMASLQEQIDKVKQSRAKIGSKYMNASKGELLFILKKIEKRKSTLSYILDERIYLTSKLNRLSISLPQGMWIETFKYQNNEDKEFKQRDVKMELQGFVFLEGNDSEMDVINKFLKDLKNDSIFMAGFNNVELSSVQKATRRDFNLTRFILKCD